MKNKIHFLAGLFLFPFFMACEDIIELDLEEAEQRIVLEATLDVDSQQAQLVFSLTNEFYQAGETDKVSGATVVLSHQDGTQYVLAETKDGVYVADNIISSPDDVFTLVVEDQGKQYTASAIVPHPAALDSLNTEMFDFPFGGSGEENFQVFAHWNDPENVPNFYRLKPYLNDTLVADVYSLTYDEFGDGTAMSIPIRELFEAENRVRIDLLSVDANYYDYFLQLSTIQGEGFNSSNPFNPKGNFDSNVLGYFGIYTTSSAEIWLE